MTSWRPFVATAAARRDRGVVGPALALAMALASGCDCSGESEGGSCEIDGDCRTGQSCVEGRCVARSDGGGGVDAGNRDAQSGPEVDAGACREISAESTVEPVPVDIIIAIDNSGSMDDEAAEVRDNINRFAEIIAMSGLDYRVVLISEERGDTGVCVPAPLGSGPPACESGPDGRLLALHEEVGSHDAPQIVLEQYPEYRDFLRVNAAKVFLWITDDEADDFTADSFRAELQDLEPAGMFERVTHNAIVGFFGDAPADWNDDGAGECETLANVGNVYLRLAACLDDDDAPIAECTAGQRGRVCETDWTNIFTALAQGVVEGVPVVCEFAIPDPPEGFDIDFEGVGVTYRSGDVVQDELDRVASEGACTASGWYYDDPSSPTTITLCPDVCRTVQADDEARLDIALGCDPRLM